MKKYTVLIPFQGTLGFDLEAETPQEARRVGQQKFNNIPVEDIVNSAEFGNYTILEEGIMFCD